MATPPNESDNLSAIKLLGEARDNAFKNSTNLDLSEEQRQQYSAKFDELSTLVAQLSATEISNTSAALTQQTELKSVTDEITSNNKRIDWLHTEAHSADANLGHLSKLIDSGKKLLALFKGD